MNQVDLGTLAQVVRCFVLPSRRDRLSFLLASPKRYDDFLHDLLHDTRYLDPRCVRPLGPKEPTVEAALAALGVDRAGVAGYLVGDARTLPDGAAGELETLLAACVGSMRDSMVFAPSLGAAYFEGHEGWGLILRRGRTGVTRPAPLLRRQRETGNLLVVPHEDAPTRERRATPDDLAAERLAGRLD